MENLERTPSEAEVKENERKLEAKLGKVALDLVAASQNPDV